ncbi:MAG: agmatine deiminase [Clostridia bacterium]|nr:agmatine deiminase [Clostridia bacterium]
MKILHSEPSCDGFRMPAEFSRHYGCIMIWPHRRDSWQYGAYEARKAFAEVIKVIAKSEKVIVCARYDDYDSARSMLPDNVRIIEMESDDSWARDVAPTFVTNGSVIRGIDWGFNAWGGLKDGLYFPWDKDNKMARKLCDSLDADCYDQRDFILEGGSIHTDGEGTLLTTEACLLSKGRNPDLSKEEIEEKLKKTLGIQKIIWLKCGIYNDETNEHIDNICAFTAPGEVVLAWTDDTDDPQYAMSKSCLDILENTTDAKGRPIKVHKLPLPKPVCITQKECDGLDDLNGEPTRIPGERLAASYVNFYIANHSVICPQFGDDNDQQAIAILSRLFPDREVVGIQARDILIGGGNIHCITQQIPFFD